MHLPDPAYVSFTAAVIALVTATTGLVRVLLEKNLNSRVAGLKKGQHRGTKSQVISKKSVLNKDFDRDLEQGFSKKSLNCGKAVRNAALLHDLGHTAFSKKMLVLNFDKVFEQSLS